ncbi:hypothetical protein HYDPIDRAFT_119461 [Hydnomerulius pinastri MD-312]|uniref:Uncharacterized protein n=1 Tax=Hydnomerulius pinastri MD-312 TaxID=994086 RepID=A0A0C9W7P4_9AGAM|nr:hypothetical protein HYDPIDRAFT_119461 [Hydnomerulius pinastri MD-312]
MPSLELLWSHPCPCSSLPFPAIITLVASSHFFRQFLIVNVQLHKPKIKQAHFLAPRSRCPASRARCLARFSAAVMRGTISGKGLSTIVID